MPDKPKDIPPERTRTWTDSETPYKKSGYEKDPNGAPSDPKTK